MRLHCLTGCCLLLLLSALWTASCEAASASGSHRTSPTLRDSGRQGGLTRPAPPPPGSYVTRTAPPGRGLQARPAHRPERPHPAPAR